MRTIQEKLRDWRWWGEQVAHVLLGVAFAAPFAAAFWFTAHPTLLLAGQLFVGICAGGRELWQNWHDAPGTNDVLDSNFDTLFTQLGGFLTLLGVYVAT